jgi:hypothetical protein
MHRGQFHAQGEQHARRSNILRGAAFSRVAGHAQREHHARGCCFLRGTEHAQGEQYARGSSSLRGTQHVQEEQHVREEACSGGDIMPRGSSMPGEATSGGNNMPRRSSKLGGGGGQHNRAIFSSFNFMSWCSLELFYCMLLPREWCSPCPLGMLHPRYTAPPAHAVPFWACCCPLGMQLPIWKAFLGMLLPPGIAAPNMEGLQEG